MFLATESMLKNPKGPSFVVFFNIETFFKTKFHQRAPLQLFDVLQQWMLENPSSPPLLAPTFEFFQICNVNEYLTLRSP